MKTGFIKYLILPIILIIIGCSPIRKTIITQKTEVIQKDSTVLRDSVVYHHLYKELYNDYTGLLDTLELETSYASAKAYVDTTNKLLKGQIKNKNKDIPIQIKWKEHIIRRDSLVFKDVPVPVEVEKVVHPKYEKFLWCYFIITFILFLIKIYIFLQKRKL